jgi:purine-binding chemotaxis protein CheW
MSPEPVHTAAAAQPHRQFATFLLGDHLCGVEVLEVQEVLRYQEMTAVPLASTAVRGLINLRGQIVTAIDLRRRFGLSPRESDVQPMNVVVRTGDGVVSLLVDEIGVVVDVGPAQFEKTPATVRGQAAGLVAGVFKLSDRLLIVLDIERVVTMTDGDIDAAA